MGAVEDWTGQPAAAEIIGGLFMADEAEEADFHATLAFPRFFRSARLTALRRRRRSFAVL